ncbi:polyprenyl synthetase family protein [Streptomyces coffeae]|uniref:Polyprenyl synthetase family protein n=1 Tax=Streptomyces coffeae TaxID=621382 RepID=A0ABS1N5B1_9ACTN|nr:polyprenyl synthetase family protein [Streptomyces coffeae]MBL1095188.1 polyprenyl synthetase family protein [Streptomyces coffeae]
MQPTVWDRTLDAGLSAGHTAVEEGLLRATRSDVPFITEAARRRLSARGPRLMPLLVLLAARFGDPDAPGVVPAAVVVELTHRATQLHDEVRDETGVRRRGPGAAGPAPDANWDNTVAVLTGDFLFARASHLLAGLGPQAVRLQAAAFKQLVTGQILETAGPPDGHDPVAHHLAVLTGRCGSLTAVSGRLGAMTAGAPPAVADALDHYGERLGVAHRLTAEADTARSADALSPDRRPTLPLLLLRSRGGANGDQELYDLLTAGPAEWERHAEAVARLRAHPVLAEVRREAVRQAQAARTALSPLPDGPAKSALDELCRAVVRRATADGD